MIQIGGFQNWVYPQIIHLTRIFHYKPSILWPIYGHPVLVFEEFLITSFLLACETMGFSATMGYPIWGKPWQTHMQSGVGSMIRI